MTSILIAIDTISSLNHTTILNRAIGASEYQYYSLLKQLSNYYTIICYNNVSDNVLIDNIHYKNYNDIIKDTIDINTPILIQRFIPTIYNENFTKIKNNKLYIWNHDNFGDHVFNFNNKEYNTSNLSTIINSVYNFNNINFVCVSEYSKQCLINYFLNYNLTLNPNRIHVIYNILYDEEFNKSKIIKKNYITYASAWHKGIEPIVHIFDELLKVDNDFTLVLLSPGYEWNNFINYADKLKTKYNNKIIIHGPVNKQEYSTIIKESLVVMCPNFAETFGCVFADSYYLGTPVIADHRSGAVKEIIDNNYVINYDNVQDVIDKILYIKQNKEHININLHYKFMLDYNINNWKNVLYSLI